MSIDAGAIVEGWHGDGARTFYVGTPPPEIAELIDSTRAAMMAGIAAAVPGNYIADISSAVEDVAAPKHFGIIRQFVGHGIGTAMHEEPQVPNFRSGRKGLRLEPGICLAIEPMFTLGTHETRILPDDWTVVTKDGSLAAHFEHSIVVTENGPVILRRRPDVLASQLPEILIRYAFVCRSSRTGTPREKGKHTASGQARCDRSGRDGHRTAPQHDVRGRAGEWPPGARPYQRQTPDEFHPDPAR